MDVVGIGNKGILAVTDTEQEYPDQVKSGNQQRRESQYGGIEMVGKGKFEIAHLNVQETQEQANRHATGIAHEYLPASSCLAKHIIIEER